MMMGKVDVRPPRPRDGSHCDLCGCSQPAVRCDKCGCQAFCLSCDDMYHRHPKRRFHLRKAVNCSAPIAQARPVLPIKVSQLPVRPGDPSKMPLPPPRKKKSGKSFFDTFRKRSPSRERSPPLPKKEYSWTDRLGNIKKFMSNRPLPPLPSGDNDTINDSSMTQSSRGDLTFIHKRVDDKPPQLPQRTPMRAPPETPNDRNINGQINGHFMGHTHVRNGTMDSKCSSEASTNGDPSHVHHYNTMNRPFYRQDMGPGFPTMSHSSSATDLTTLPPGMPPPHYPYPHMAMPYPYPMYPQYPNYPPYFGSSFANLSRPPTEDGDSDGSDTSSKHQQQKRQSFKKRAKRSQSVLMDKMAFPGQFYPFGPFPPGYGPWGPAYPMKTPPSPASSIRSLNRVGRSSRSGQRKKTTSEEEDEAFSMSSSPLSRPKSSSSERQNSASAKKTWKNSSSDRQRILSKGSSSSEDDNEAVRTRSRAGKGSREESYPKRPSSSSAFRSPQNSRKLQKQKKKDASQDNPSLKDTAKTFNEQINDDRDNNQAASVWIPPRDWQCPHCTFVNSGGNRICQVCCKTALEGDVTLIVTNETLNRSSVSSDKRHSSPEKITPDNVDDKKEKQDISVLNSALDAAEKEINRGIKELMKLQDDISTESPTDMKHHQENTSKAKPVYRSSGKLRSSILDKLSLPTGKQASTSTSTETSTQSHPTSTDRVIEARLPSTSSTASDAYNSPMVQSPEPKHSENASKKESSCQTQNEQDNDLMDYIERKKLEDEAYRGMVSNGYPYRVSSPPPMMFDRGVGGPYSPMYRSHSRSSLFSGRINDSGPVDFGLSPGSMYRSVSRVSLGGDYPDRSFSDFRNFRKPDYYLSMEELVERRRQDAVRAQGLELVRMIREAEQQGFTADDIQIALSSCGKQNPLEWLQDNYQNMVENVINLSTNYGNDKKENDIGTVSEVEAKDALRIHKGNTWAAVTECVETRQLKFQELKSRGKFSTKDVTDALTSSEGDVDMALTKLTKSHSRPFLMRIWGAGEGVQNLDGAVSNSKGLINTRENYFAKDSESAIQSDEFSEEYEDEDIDWGDEDIDDAEDLRTCRDDLFIPGEVTSPESDDKSDYCDAFVSNTLERNANLSKLEKENETDDNQFKKKAPGILSKIGLRKDGVSGKEDILPLDHETPNTNIVIQKDEIMRELEVVTKNRTPLGLIKSTISAIRDTVGGTTKKVPCAAPDRRLIVVSNFGKRPDHNASQNVELKSVKKINEDFVDIKLGQSYEKETVEVINSMEKIRKNETDISQDCISKAVDSSKLNDFLSLDFENPAKSSDLPVNETNLVTRHILQSNTFSINTTDRVHEKTTTVSKVELIIPPEVDNNIAYQSVKVEKTDNTSTVRLAEEIFDSSDNSPKFIRSDSLNSQMKPSDVKNTKAPSLSSLIKNVQIPNSRETNQFPNVSLSNDIVKESSKLKLGIQDQLTDNSTNTSLNKVHSPYVENAISRENLHNYTLSESSNKNSNKLEFLNYNVSENSKKDITETNLNQHIESTGIKKFNEISSDTVNVMNCNDSKNQIPLKSTVSNNSSFKIQASSSNRNNIPLLASEAEKISNLIKPNDETEVQNEESDLKNESNENFDLELEGVEFKITDDSTGDLSIAVNRSLIVYESNIPDQKFSAEMTVHEPVYEKVAGSIDTSPSVIGSEKIAILNTKTPYEENSYFYEESKEINENNLPIMNIDDEKAMIVLHSEIKDTGAIHTADVMVDKDGCIDRNFKNNEIDLRVNYEVLKVESSISESPPEKTQQESADIAISATTLDTSPTELSIPYHSSQSERTKILDCELNVTNKEKQNVPLSLSNEIETQSSKSIQLSIFDNHSLNEVPPVELSSPNFNLDPISTVTNSEKISTQEQLSQTKNKRDPEIVSSSIDNNLQINLRTTESFEIASDSHNIQDTFTAMQDHALSKVKTTDDSIAIEKPSSENDGSLLKPDKSTAASNLLVENDASEIVEPEREINSLTGTDDSLSDTDKSSVGEDEVAVPTTSSESTDIQVPKYNVARRRSSAAAIDVLRSRFEGLINNSVTSGLSSVRPQSPMRRMSFNSRKTAIALERTKETKDEKSWIQQPITDEVLKKIRKRNLTQQLEIERRIRKIISERKCSGYKKAEIVVQLMDMNFEEEESVLAANECSTLEKAISYLQQECLLCTGNFPVSYIISMVHCPHKACRECLRAYFTVQIRDRNIMELLCPFCNEPDITDEETAQDYFNHMDIMLKKLVDVDIHELFQRKLRDRVLMRDPNFRWCSQCSSGFISMPNLTRLVCPDCNAVTCASCKRPWEREHQGKSCEAFAAWKDAADPESQSIGIAKLLTEDGIDCPRCHFRYALAKGGCMHFRCIQCQHDFCSGCSRPFKMGQKCGVSEFCAKLGLHAHHPRNCLFYLRDKDPEDLQKLLDLCDVKYDRDPQIDLELKKHCHVMEQKETADGMMDDHCGKVVEDGYAGLCRLHYVEYLGQLVNQYKVDPIRIFDNDDLELVLKRANIRLPPKKYRETDAQYREKLVDLIEEELPLDKAEGS